MNSEVDNTKKDTNRVAPLLNPNLYSIMENKNPTHAEFAKTIEENFEKSKFLKSESNVCLDQTKISKSPSWESFEEDCDKSYNSSNKFSNNFKREILKNLQKEVSSGETRERAAVARFEMLEAITQKMHEKHQRRERNGLKFNSFYLKYRRKMLFKTKNEDLFMSQVEAYQLKAAREIFY